MLPTKMAKNVDSYQSVALMLLLLALQTTGYSMSNFESEFFYKSAKGRRLVNCCISETMVSSLFECGHLCLTHGCQSFNYGQMENLSRQLYRCELNNCTKDDHLLSVDPKFDFYELIKEAREWSNEKSCQESSSVVFPVHTTSDYVQIDGQTLPPLSAISICSWAQFAVNANGTILSYFVPTSLNELGIWCFTNEVIISVKDSWFYSQNSVISDESWHAMCVTWSSVDGNLTVYRDNTVTDSYTGVHAGQMVSGGGLWVLGQDQDSWGGGFDIVDSFHGEMAELNVWSRVLSRQEIAEFSTDCERCMNGDVISWSEFKTGLRGDVFVKQEPSCAN